MNVGTLLLQSLAESMHDGFAVCHAHDGEIVEELQLCIGDSTLNALG